MTPLTAGEAALVYKAYLTTTTKGKELVAVKNGKGVCVCVCVVCVYLCLSVCVCVNFTSEYLRLYSSLLKARSETDVKGTLNYAIV